jgi:hypothetical protein
LPPAFKITKSSGVKIRHISSSANKVNRASYKNNMSPVESLKNIREFDTCDSEEKENETELTFGLF